MQPGATFTTTLVWRAERETRISYHVFLHLLGPDGTLVAQSDGIPAGWTRPTTSWAPGEIIVDPHLMTFKAEHLDYIGPATISVGLYDPATGRVPTETGDESVILPITINVVSQ